MEEVVRIWQQLKLALTWTSPIDDVDDQFVVGVVRHEVRHTPHGQHVRFTSRPIISKVDVIELPPKVERLSVEHPVRKILINHGRQLRVHGFDLGRTLLFDHRESHDLCALPSLVVNFGIRLPRDQALVANRVH